jgi:formamidopyrimidine-DNA glycosylase
MPELPEVETISRELNAELPGRRIEAIEVFRADALSGVAPRAFRRSLVGRTIQGCARRGKFLIFSLDPESYLVSHLRMTGKFAVSPPLDAPQPYHRLWFHLNDGRVLVFQDLRCFGTLEFVRKLSESESLGKLGLDPLSRRFNAGWLAEALAASRAPLKHWLMDQTRIAGLGNIYASEILYAARISPKLPCDRLDSHGVGRLVRETRRILRNAIRKNGTTISDFRRVDEQRGEFQNFLKVYGKTGEPCPRCRTPIERIVQQQRSTFFCPTCQPALDMPRP